MFLENCYREEAKLKQSLKVKLKMAKFLQKTLDSMSVCGKGHSEFTKEFVDSFVKARIECAVIPANEMLKFTKLFEDEITLDSLPRPQLVALCRVLEIQPIRTSSVLKYILTRKLRSLTVDDKNFYHLFYLWVIEYSPGLIITYYIRVPTS
ncbi:unnamed protein product [Aphis gossypii]|uniref:Letm1 RBD domain-containing protein n=1 Tax=Aphis gossypii TaxID=80765 RepID=A0A9P0NDX5_APHGO|nr:unnamed protein product [Aphis gossypii]